MNNPITNTYTYIKKHDVIIITDVLLSILGVEKY